MGQWPLCYSEERESYIPILILPDLESGFIRVSAGDALQWRERVLHDLDQQVPGLRHLRELHFSEPSSLGVRGGARRGLLVCMCVLQVWDVNGWEYLGTLEGHRGTVYDLAALETPGQTKLFSASYDKTIRVLRCVCVCVHVCARACVWCTVYESIYVWCSVCESV